MAEVLLADASPSKNFFIHMITRDLRLKEAIVELVDNSLDGAKRWRTDGNFNGLFIKIFMNEDEFIIEDNCGGIDLELAQKIVFRFGKPSDAPRERVETTGIFGIGMKRTLFKLGRYFEINSTTINSSFTVKWDVEEWSKTNGNWDIPFSVYDSNKHPADECGTKIIVNNLFDGISVDFISTTFQNELITHLQKRVSFEMDNGLQIFINGTLLEATHIGIVNENEFPPIKELYESDDVKVKIILAIADKPSPKEAGWYVYCNNRLILSSDKSSITTWNDDAINIGTLKYHNNYAVFRGFVFFNSDEPEKLPWNTTKTGIDTSSPIYIEARKKMIDHFKAFTELINKMRQSEEELKAEVTELDEDIPEIVYEKAPTIIRATPQIIAREVKENLTIRLDNIKVNPNPLVTITYKKPLKEVEKVKKALGATSNKEAGLGTFDYYIGMECE